MFNFKVSSIAAILALLTWPVEPVPGGILPNKEVGGVLGPHIKFGGKIWEGVHKIRGKFGRGFTK